MRLAEAHLTRVGDVPGSLIERESGQLREAHRRAGHDVESDPTVSKLMARGLPPIGGGAIGKGQAAFFINLPPEGTFDIVPDYFNQETERNDVPQEVKAFTGLGGSRIDQRISNVGILANVRLVFKGSLVVAGGGTVTATYQWPWNVAKKVTLNANGQTSLIQAEGLDLRARRNRLYRNPKDDVSVAPATNATTIDPAPAVIANGTYSVVLVYDLPIVHDATTLSGALFAQSDANYLNWTIEPALASDLFTLAGGSTATLTGSFYPTLEFFDIPYVDTQQGRRVAIPDLRWLHGYLASNQPFANTGDVKTPFIKTAGQLIAYYLYIDNGGAAQIDPLSTSLDEFRLEYGANRRPRVFSPMEQAYEEQARNFNGRIQPKYMVIDLEIENPDRDIIYPRGVSELQAVTKINGGVTVNANARVHFVEETLFSGV